MTRNPKLLITHYWPELLTTLAPIIVFWRLIFGGQVLYWALPSLQFVPWRALVNDALRECHLPLWTPLLGMGAPLMANLQSATFYPPNLLALILPPETAVSVLAVLHLSFAGVGMARLARHIGLSDFGAALAGLAFGLSGYLTARLWFITINNALAWLPWIVLAASPQATIRLKKVLTLSALLALQLLAGHAQSTFYTLLIASAWLAWHSKFPKEIVKNGLAFGLACILALCLAAVQLIPTYELLRQSPRADAAEYEFAMTYSFWPWRLFTFVAPNFFGHPADHNYWGYATYWEDAGYMGLLPLIFAIYIAYCVFRKRSTRYALRNTSIFLLALAFMSILLALGKNTPLYPFFYFYVPGFRLFQAPARLLVGYTFALSLLAGIGGELWQASDRKRYWARLGLAGGLAMTGLGVAGMFLVTDSRANTFAAGTAGAAATAVAALALILTQPTQPNRWRWAALAFVTLDLGLAAVRLNPTIDSVFYHLQPSALPASGRIYQYADDEYRVKFKEFFRFQSFDEVDPQTLRNSLLPNLSALNGIASANNFDPLLTARYSRYIEAMEHSPQLLDLAGVRTLVKPMQIVTTRSTTAVQLRVVYQARMVNDEETALAAVTAPAFDPNAEAILESIEPSQFGLALDPNRFTTQVMLDRYGWVVVSDVYYPGWRAFVDGQPQPTLRANYLFRAVAVPAGQHTVTFEYAPLSVTMGLAISAAAIVVWAGLWIFQVARLKAAFVI
jgi:hypothetical protein